MGAGGAKISLNANQEGSDGGGKSIISDPFDELSISEDKFWELFAKVQRDPLRIPADSPHLKVVKHETTDLEDGSFRTIDTVAGLPWGESAITMTHSFDREKNLWTTVADRAPDFNKVTVHLYTKLLREPMRVECWSVSEFSRLSGAPLKEAVNYTVGHILRKLPTEAAVELKADVDSPSGDGKKSIVSAPLDDIMPVEKFWDLYEDVHREGFPLPFLTSSETEDYEDGFHVTQNFGYGAKIMHTFHKIDRANNVASATIYNSWPPQESEKTQQFCTKAHQNPFILEVWMDSFPQRSGDEGLKMVTQSVMDQIVEEAQKESGSGGGWFS